MRNVTIFSASGVDVKTTNGTTAAFDVSAYERLKMYFNLTALAGGTTPTVRFWYQEQDDYGQWYDDAQVAFADLSAPGKQVQSVGPGTAYSEMLGKAGRIRWTVVGAPTTATATITVIADED